GGDRGRAIRADGLLRRVLPLADAGAGAGVMFPAPIARAPRATRIAYRAALFASLAVWLLPMLGVALTSIRSIEDLNRGNLWGWPSEFRLVENYAAVFADTRMAQFILNSVLITVPAVVGAVALACM